LIDSDSDKDRYWEARKKFDELFKVLAGAWNWFIEESRGDYILSLEHDVLPQEGTYKKLIEGLNKHPEAGAMACPAKTRHKAHKNVTMIRVERTKGVWGKFYFAESGKELFEPCGWSSLSCILFRKELIEDVVLDGTATPEKILAHHIWAKQRQTWVRWDVPVKHYLSEGICI